MKAAESRRTARSGLWSELAPPNQKRTLEKMPSVHNNPDIYTSIRPEQIETYYTPDIFLGTPDVDRFAFDSEFRCQAN